MRLESGIWHLSRAGTPTRLGWEEVEAQEGQESTCPFPAFRQCQNVSGWVSLIFVYVGGSDTSKKLWCLNL